MKKRLFLSLFAVFAVVVLVGCESKKGLVGKWEYDGGGYVYTFNEDKTCSYSFGSSEMKCTYTVDGDKLSILYDGNSASFDTTYKIDGNTLTIKDSFDNDVKYNRK